MENIAQEITTVGNTLVRVQAEIEAVERKLDAEGLSENDVTYWRRKEEQLRRKEEQLREEKLLLLRNQLSQGRPPLHLAESDANLARKFDLLLEQTRATDRATPQYSSAHIGAREKKRLQLDDRFIDFEGRVGEERILSSEEQELLSSMENEHQVVAFLTPHLQRIFCTGDEEFSVFNSEEYKWIATSSETTVYNEKPDLLICHPAITSYRPPFNSRDNVLDEMRKKYSFEYGVLSNWELRGAIGLTCEAKVSIDNKGFGEVINYGAHLCFGKDGPAATRLILFDKTQCWLVGVVKGHVSDVNRFKWRDEGSVTLLRDFIRLTPLTRVLTAACQQFQVTVGQDSFLGAGACGFVFRAIRSDGNVIALKVVEGDGVLRLERENAIMKEAHEACPEAVMGIEEDGFAIFEDIGGALLLSKVGRHYSKLDPQSIVDSLKTLHASGIVHGDARLDNVVCVEEKPVWIDFADSILSPATPMVQTQDDEMETLKACVRRQFNGYNAS